MTDKIKRHPLADIAPYPATVDDATADALVKHFAAFGLMHNWLATEFVPGKEDTQWRQSVACVVSSFTTAYMLAELEDKAGLQAADAAARELWSSWEAGDAVAGWLWQTASEFGLDMKVIERAADQVTQNIRAKAAGASPEVHPDQAEIPSP
ncbi:hypothetical protein [Nonomuraea guangzhouensis]|uniref:Uncharacterized protein n=1 Tax=Nonomuraea guangzhouensis TaxID=1291555 RepID=A0ABW4GX55_9ACTN|nr:hypothetical protein [Nonomuraea guangzhouensis]